MSLFLNEGIIPPTSHWIISRFSRFSLVYLRAEWNPRQDRLRFPVASKRGDEESFGRGEEKKTEKKSRPSRDPPGRESPLGSRCSCRSRFLSNNRPIDRVWNRSTIGRHGGNDADRGSAYCSSFSLLCRYLCYPLPFCSGHRGTWGGCDFDDARRHPSREPRDVIDSLEAALTFDLRLELVHLRFYRVSQFCNSQRGNCVICVSLLFLCL